MTTVRSRLRRLPLRIRLVAGFSVAMLVLLTGAGAFVYWRVQYALDRGLDTELQSATEVIEPLVTANGTVSSPDAATATGAGWQVLGADGRVLDSGGAAPARPLVSGSGLAETADAGVRTVDVGSFLSVADATYRVRVTALPANGDGGPAFLLVGVRRDHRDEALRELLVQLTIAGLAALVVASLVGDALARLALRPVERYRRHAVDIAGGATGLRLEVPELRDDEVTRLGHTLNEMLAALEEALERERRFVNDASHELRTPLTLLQSRIQLARRRPRSVTDLERVLDELAVDVTRLIDLAEQLLEVPGPAITDGVADVGSVVEHVAGRWHEAHPGRADDVTVRAEPGPTTARIDQDVLGRVVTNLLTNALTHGAPPVWIGVRHDGDHVVLEVSDAGAGMPPDLLGEATRRFTRAPEARSRPGSGLGLSIVEDAVTDAGGELRMCCGGHHVTAGGSSPVPCRHGDRMTVTVVLPRTTAQGGRPPAH